MNDAYANPFDDEAGRFLVLVNEKGQHSLWPSFKPVPKGWRVALAESSRADALSFVEEHWTVVP